MCNLTRNFVLIFATLFLRYHYFQSNDNEEEVHNSIYKQDFICLSETYLDSPSSDSLLELEGYNLVCTVHPNNIKRD